MRILADENFPKIIVDKLRISGHDLLWARTDCAGWKDTALLELAEAQQRIILPLDKDFWHISQQRKVPLTCAGVILFRIHPATTQNLVPLVESFLRSSVDWSGHISIITADGIQMLPVTHG